MQTETLSLKQIKAVYTGEFKKDFIKDELKPWRVMKKLFLNGILEGVGLFDGGTMIAAAFILKKNERVVLIDYLDVFAPNRRQGVGSEFLKRLKEKYSMYKSIVVEVETDENAGEDKELSTAKARRLSFYYKNGFELRPVRSKMYGSCLKILELVINPDELDLYYELWALYFLEYPKRKLRNGKITLMRVSSEKPLDDKDLTLDEVNE